MRYKRTPTISLYMKFKEEAKLIYSGLVKIEIIVEVIAETGLEEIFCDAGKLFTLGHTCVKIQQVVHLKFRYILSLSYNAIFKLTVMKKDYLG